MKHLLDTSALCAHFLRQAGAEEMDRLFAGGAGSLAVCVISWFEMRYALRRCGVAVKDAEEALALYRELPLLSLPVTDPVVSSASEIRDAVPARLPLADALIAGCAARHGMVLVHRDAHLDVIPNRLVKQLRLPDATGGSASRVREKRRRRGKRDPRAGN